MKLTTNLATRRYVDLGRLNALLIAGFVLLGGLLIFKVREVAYNQAELGRIRGLSSASDRRPGGGPAVTEAQLKELSARTGFANSLIEKKSTNWLALLDSLEEVVPTGVALTAINPKQGQVMLNGVARSFANLRLFVENLEHSRNFSEVYLLSQSETKVGLTQQGISFAVTCKVSPR